MNDQWSLIQKIIFRFSFCYFVLYVIPFPFYYIPGLGDFISTWINKVWEILVPLVDHTFFQIDYEYNDTNTGSGDKTWNYLSQVVTIGLSLFFTIVWTLLDNSRINYYKLHYYLTILLRFYLLATMLNYGLIKIIKTQFPFPGLWPLLTPLGESTPMALAWNFMGYSPGYNMFTGLGEAIAGLLLISRRTTSLGALLAVAVMSNVVMINFCYDVPVKLYSFNLLLIAFYLIIPDIKRMVQFFFLNVPVTPKANPPLFLKPVFKYGAIGLKIIFVGYLIYTYSSTSLTNQKKWGEKASKPALYGIYDTKIFTLNQDTLLPLTTDSLRWKRMIVEWEGMATVQYMNESIKTWKFDRDTIQNKITLSEWNDTINKYDMIYTSLDDGKILLDGVLLQDTIHLELQRKDLNDFPLISRKFQWINERPFNGY